MLTMYGKCSASGLYIRSTHLASVAAEESSEGVLSGSLTTLISTFGTAASRSGGSATAVLHSISML